MLGSARIIGAMKAGGARPELGWFEPVLAAPAGPAVQALTRVRFGGGATRMAARALEDHGIEVPAGLDPAAFAFVVAGGLALGAPPWPRSSSPADALTSALRAEPDLLDQVAIGGAARFVRDPGLRESAVAWGARLAELAPELHRAARAWVGEPVGLGERAWAMVGGAPDVSGGGWARPVVLGVLEGLLGAQGEPD